MAAYNASATCGGEKGPSFASTPFTWTATARIPSVASVASRLITRLRTAAFCMPSDGVRDYRIPHDEIASYCVPFADHPRVTVGHGAVGAPVVDGWLALERVDVR